MPLKKWKQIDSKVIFENGYWSYRLDDFELDDGYKGEYHYVHTNGSTMSIPITKDGRIILVKQYRYLNQRESIEFPCGAVSEGISAEENALKELREETGYTSKKLIKIGEFSPYTGASDEITSLFLALELEASPLQKDRTEEFELLELEYKKVKELIENNIIWDGLTLAAWTLAKKELKKLL